MKFRKNHNENGVSGQIAMWVKMLRKQRGMTQEQFAEFCVLGSRNEVNALENGKATKGDERIFKIATKCGVIGPHNK